MEGRVVVLVNGLPAAGKTTLARSLARELRLPLFSKGVIKEEHAAVFGAAAGQGLVAGVEPHVRGGGQRDHVSAAGRIGMRGGAGFHLARC